MKNLNIMKPWGVVVAATILVIAIIVLGNRLFQTSEQTAFDEFNQRQLVLAEETSKAIELFFETLAGGMRGLGEIPEIQQFEETPTRREIWHSLQNLSVLGVNDIGVMDAFGVVRFTVVASQLEGVDFSWRQYYQEAKDLTSTDAYTIEFIEFQGVDVGEKGVLLAVPMFRQDEFVGVVLCTLKLDTVVERFVADVKSSENGYTFLVDDESTLLWAPDNTLQGANMLEFAGKFPSFQQILINMTHGESGTGEYSFYQLDQSQNKYIPENQEEYIIAYSPIRLGAKLWTIGVTTLKSDARQLVQSVYRTQLSLVLLSILTILSSSVYSIAVLLRTGRFLEREVEAKTRELQAAHERLVTILDSMDAAVYVADIKTYEILFGNEYLKEIWGNVVGKACWQAVQVNQDGPCKDCITPKILTTDGQPGEVSSWESQNEINGCWYANRARAIRWIDGRIVRLEIAVDITERKKAENALRASEEKYRQLVEFAPNTITIQDADKLIFINPAGAKMLGAESPEELIGKPVADFLLPEDHRTYSKRFPWIIEVGRTVHLKEQKLIRVDGSFVDTEVVAIPFIYQNQPAIQVIYHDITEWKRAEEEIGKLREAVNASGEAIFLTDREGIITFVNPEFTRLYGFTAEELVGKKTPRVLKSGVMKQKDYEIFWETLLNKEVVRSELINKCKDGQLLTVEGSANPILNENGNIVGFLAIQRDISARKQAENEIRQRNKELSVLNAIASTVNQSFEINQIIDDSLGKILHLDLLGDDAYGMIFLLDEKTGKLKLATHKGAPEDHPCLASPPQMGECLCGLAVKTGKVIVSDNSSADGRHTRNWSGMPEHKDICLPLKARGKGLGVLDVRIPTDKNIDPGDIELLKSVADQISVAIENARLRELREQAIVEERERIARELHDGLAQLLTYLNSKVIAARLRLRKREIEDTDEHLRQLEEATQTLFIDVREAILNLRMSGEIGGEFVTLIREYLATFTKLSGLSVEFTTSPEVESISISSNTQLQLLRIIQGALSNVRKHSCATQARVELLVSEQVMTITISDNGIGFVPDKIDAKEPFHLGLTSMLERAEEIGAELLVESSPGAGTQITISKEL